MNPSIPELVRTLARWLDENKGKLPRDKLEDTVVWIRRHAGKRLTEEDSAVLRGKVCAAFSITEEELFAAVNPDAKIEVAKEDDFIPHIPKSGWLSDYIAYTQFCEAPTAYHFFSAVTVIGAALKRNVWKSQGLWKIYPNFATLLTGPSTVTRKTTATDIAWGLGVKSGQIRLVGENFTAEALVADLAEGDEAVGLAYVPELAATLSKAKYAETLVPILTRLWDCPDVLPTSRITRGRITLYNVALSLLAASNEVWLVEAIPDSAFKGGFMARIIQVYQDRTLRRFPEPPLPDLNLADSLRDRLETAGYLRGEIYLSPGASRWYNERYNAILDAIPEDERLAPFHGRLPDHILRMALVLRLAENNFLDRPDEARVEIELKQLEAADRVMSWVTQYLPHVYESLGLSTVGEDLVRIKHFLKRKGGYATRPQLVRHMGGRVTSRQLDERMSTLIASGEVMADEKGLWHGYELVKRRRHD